MKKLISSVLLLGTLVSSAVGVYADEPKKAEVQSSEATQQASENPEFFNGAKGNLAALKGKAAESFGEAKEKFAAFKGKTDGNFSN